MVTNWETGDSSALLCIIGHFIIFKVVTQLTKYVKVTNFDHKQGGTTSKNLRLVYLQIPHRSYHQEAIHGLRGVILLKSSSIVFSLVIKGSSSNSVNV